MILPALTTADKVNLRLSQVGVDKRTDHAAQPLVLNDCISQASGDVAMYLAPRYALADLATSEAVANWTADVAVYHVCRTRANGVPASVQKRFDWVMQQLQAVRNGQLLVPDLSAGVTAPAVKNYREDFSQYPPKRVETTRSNPRTTTGFPAYPDRKEPYPL